MASLTRDACEDRAAARPPLSRHPAFPKLVAAWFAGLFGAGCLILPGLLLERFVDATGLGAIAPVLAPPLSSAARAFLALAAAGLGGGLGALIAAHVARAHRAAPAGMPEPRASRQPISAHAELGAHGLTGAPRRSLLAEVLPEPLAAPSPDGRRDADEPLDLLVFADACLEPAAEAPVPRAGRTARRRAAKAARTALGRSA
ncbi:MAG: hypothetical protein B7Z08_05015 [Sphingomonadales bacterium 32-68-7]|nr:MAG: hypothetical protein B7Z08_05015 [Sphingomonadales bacterium 32-68-7]